MRRILLLLLPLLSVAASPAITLGPEKPPVVAAASDLKFAVEEVAKAFTKQTGARVDLVFGANTQLRSSTKRTSPATRFASG